MSPHSPDYLPIEQFSKLHDSFDASNLLVTIFLSRPEDNRQRGMAAESCNSYMPKCVHSLEAGRSDILFTIKERNFYAGSARSESLIIVNGAILLHLK